MKSICYHYCKHIQKVSCLFSPLICPQQIFDHLLDILIGIIWPSKDHVDEFSGSSEYLLYLYTLVTLNGSSSVIRCSTVALHDIQKGKLCLQLSFTKKLISTLLRRGFFLNFNFQLQITKKSTQIHLFELFIDTFIKKSSSL